MKNFLIVGSSASAGYGLTEEEISLSFWPTLLVNNSKFKSCQLLNASIVGADNQEIFNEAYTRIKTRNFNHAMITWSVVPRTNVNYGFEEYRTTSPYITFSDNFSEINLVNTQKITIQQQIKQRFNLRYYNYHWDILDLMIKANVLIDIGNQYACQVGFVNFNLPWQTEKIFERVNWNLPSELGKLTKEILSVSDRDDTEIKKLYNIMHNSYDKVGGIHESNWLNLYNPFYMYQIDSRQTGHPGPKSQSVIADFLQTSFNRVFV